MPAAAPLPRISFLVPDISSPILGAAVQMAFLLEGRLSVDIVGPDFGGGVCPMYRGAFPFTSVPCPRLYRFPDWFWESRRLSRALSAPVVLAFKAFASTIPVALAARRRTGAKVAVYLDEWDGAIASARYTRRQRLARWLRHAHHPMEDIYNPLVERLIPRCDAVLSTTTALQRKFGGTVIPFGTDTAVFAPQPPERTAALRASLGLQGRRLVVFGGVVRPHKGVEWILSALARIADPHNALLVVGPVNEHVRDLLANPEFAPYLVAIGPRPKAEMPQYLDLADLVVLPLNDDPLAQTQMPCKVFEAMAMAKPVVASRVADMPLVLDGGGLTVPPGDVTALADAIRSLLSDPARAAALARLAREKCIREYSAPVASQKLLSVLLPLFPA